MIDEQQREILFAKKLGEIKKTALDRGRTIDEKTVRESLSDLELDGQQLELVYDYLHKQGIELEADIEDNAEDSIKDIIEAGIEDIFEDDKGEEDHDAPGLSLTGTRGDMEAFVVSFVSVIEDMARLYEGQGVLKEDLIGEGTLAAFEATLGLPGPADDSERQALETHLAGTVINAMEALVYDNLDQKDIEQNVLDRVKKVSDAASELSEVLRRKVTVEELLLEEEELTEEDIRLAIRLSGGSIDVK